MTPHIKHLLVGFHHRVARRILGKMPRRRAQGTWEYPPLGGVMRENGLEDIDMYIFRRKNTASQYIAMRPILDLCLDTERNPGSQVQKWWW